MKTMMRCLVIVLFVCTISTQSMAQWVKTNLDSNVIVNALAVSGNNLFAGTNNGVFRSTDNGVNWIKTTLDSVLVISFAISGTNLFAGAVDYGIFLSSDNGSNWKNVNSGIPPEGLNYGLDVSFRITALAFKPNGSDTNDVFAATIFTYTPSRVAYLVRQRIYRSTNNGTNWILSDSGFTNNIITLLVDGSNLFAGTGDNINIHSGPPIPFPLYGDGVLLSTDNGNSWTAVNSGLPKYSLQDTTHYSNINALIKCGIYLFAGTNNGIYLSTNDGINWTKSKDTVVTTSCTVSGNNLFAGTNNGVFLSTNNGASWISVSTGLLDTSINSLNVAGTNLFAGTNNGVWRRPLSEMIPTTDSLLVPVAGGTFTAGTTPVTISSFKIDKYEVTYELWTAVRDWALTHGYTDLVTGKNGYNPVGVNNPVDSVNWYDVVKWCNARSEKDGLTPVYYTNSTQDTVYRTGNLDINLDAVKWTANGYRLPTEAEWEFAARGGNSTHGYTYSGSDIIDSVAWYSDNSNETTHTGGTKQPNELGIYDMSGNVIEWCWDWYGSAYPSGGTTDPKGPSTTQIRRLLRGGSFDDIYGSRPPVPNPFCRVDGRNINEPGFRGGNFGFRCVQGSQVSTAAKDESRMPQTFGLTQNYPNPFNPTTTICYSLPSSANVKLAVYDLLGREIATLVNEEQSAGWKEVQWNAKDVSSGIYFYQLQANDKREIKKMILMR